MHLVCGEALYDIFVEREAGGEIHEVWLRAVSGGSPHNVALGLARLGVKVAFATDIARDELGDRLARRMNAEAISDRFIRRDAPTTAFALVTVGQDGVPSYGFSGLREAMLAPDVSSILDQIEEFSNLHLGSIALILPQSAETLLTLAREVSKTRLVSFDPNVRLAVEPNALRWRAAIEKLRSFAHVVKVSDEDIASAYGETVDPRQLCQQWLSGRTELVVLTLGAVGAMLFTRTAEPVAIAAVSTPVIDTVGAGDSFMAALLARLSQKGRLAPGSMAGQTVEELEDIGVFAAAAAALTCSNRGPAMPRYPEVETLAARVREGKKTCAG